MADLWAKDCSCLDHTVPHWLWMDAVNRELNMRPLRAMIASGRQGYPGELHVLAHGVAAEEIARLQAKRRMLERLGVSAIPAEVIERLERERVEAPKLRARRLADDLRRRLRSVEKRARALATDHAAAETDTARKRLAEALNRVETERGKLARALGEAQP